MVLQLQICLQKSGSQDLFGSDLPTQNHLFLPIFIHNPPGQLPTLRHLWLPLLHHRGWTVLHGALVGHFALPLDRSAGRRGLRLCDAAAAGGGALVLHLGLEQLEKKLETNSCGFCIFGFQILTFLDFSVNCIFNVIAPLFI